MSELVCIWGYCAVVCTITSGCCVYADCLCVPICVRWTVEGRGRVWVPARGCACWSAQLSVCAGDNSWSPTFVYAGMHQLLFGF